MRQRGRGKPAWTEAYNALRPKERDAAMRVATYNVHDCVGRDGRFAPGRIAEVSVEIDPDAVAAQKVTLHRARDLIGRLEAPF